MNTTPAPVRPLRDPRTNEQRYFDALKRITLYQSVDRLRRRSEKEWGVEFPEVLEMVYENVKSEAERAIRGKRRPKDRVPQTTPEVSGPTPEATYQMLPTRRKRC
jgi:hypothetical protein